MKKNGNKSGKNQSIELMNEIDKSKNHNKTNKCINNKENSKEIEEDEDVLKKFQDSRKNKEQKINNFKLGNFKREAALSTVRHQIQDKFSLDKLGKIKWAKEHASANRPMNKIKEFNKYTKFCNCCNLPCKTPGIIEPFSACEKSENFSVCGRAVPLYFYFIKYCIYCLIIVLIMMSLPMAYINYGISSESKDYCIHIKNVKVVLYEKINNTCDIFLNKNNSDDNIFFNFFGKISSDNLQSYNYIFSNSTNNYINENSICNYSLLGFICMLTLFIINVYFIILFKAQIKAEKSENAHPSDYTLLITNLTKIMRIFKEKSNKIENIIIEKNNNEDLKGGLFEYEYNHVENINSIKSEIVTFIQYLKDNLFYNEISKQNMNIFNLNLCYKLNDFMILKEKYEKSKYKIFQIEHNPYQIEKNQNNNYTGKNSRYYTSIFTYLGLDWLYCSDKGITLEELNNEKNTYDKRLNLLINKAKLNNFCGCAFVTFNTIEEKEEFYNNYPHFLVEFIFYYVKKGLFYTCYCCTSKNPNLKKKYTNKRIRVYLAPEPEDIIWENLEFTIFQRAYRIIFIYFLSLVLILLAFSIVYQLTVIQDEINDNWKGIKKYGGAFLITIIISLINLLFEYLMKFFTKMEKQKSMTNYYLSFSIKLSIFTFVNSALVPLVPNILNGNLKKHENKNLITNIIFIFLANSFLTPIMWTINISLIIKKIRIYFLEKKKIPDSMHHKTQKELNELYEYPDMDISVKYSYLSKTLFITMFYLPIFPFGVLISFLGLILAYFLEKFNFTHSYKRPEMLNEKLGEIHFNFFISVQIFYSIGNYIFMNDLLKKDYWKIVNITLFCILAIIPYTKPISYYFNSSNNFKGDSQTFNDLYFSFYNDYQRQNPFTKKEGLYFYINELKNKGYISDFLYEIMIKNIEKINIMSIYHNASLNRNLRESRIILNKNKKRCNLQELKDNLKKMISEKENKLKALHESIGVKNSEIEDNIKSLNEKNYFQSQESNSEEYMNYKNKNIKIDHNKINIEPDNNSSNKIINNTNELPALVYKLPLLVNIGLEIDNLASMDFTEDNNKEEKINKIYSTIEEENSSEENEINLE